MRLRLYERTTDLGPYQRRLGDGDDLQRFEVK